MGRIAGLHGLKGWVRVESFAESLESLVARGCFLVEPVGGVPRTYTVEGTRLQNVQVLIKFREIDTVENARRLLGGALLVDRSDLPEPEEGEYYWLDLMGLDVRDSTGEWLGSVDQVVRTAAQDLLSVRGDHGVLLIPVVPEWVEEVDLERGELVLSVGKADIVEPDA